MQGTTLDVSSMRRGRANLGRGEGGVKGSRRDVCSINGMTRGQYGAKGQESTLLAVLLFTLGNAD